METFFTNIKERVLYFTDYKGFAKEKFFEELGVTYGNFKGKAKEKALSSDVLAKIVSKYPELNPEWLLTGEGEMLKSENTSTETSKEESVKGIPLVNATAIGGYGNNVFSFEERDVKDYYVIPKFKHKQVDFMIEVEGSSMYPKYNSGDVVACRIIKERNFIQWNKTHVIATRKQGIIIKRIKPSDAPNSLLMVSDNESYDPFNVPEEEIEGLAIVVGVIRLE
ncbi:S24 family peptidase [Bergeyella cardium]|uniref:Peptidase S24/S26A/S26B/S26C domain-containing protein n=1 Tax=Bergeyella cardium TaxID=1585976 RepID=A0A6P1QY02_9FLAO|nr:helix-turn-helix transcriptional regulator [Bergeyella cardium]QHN65614.1 hypothetical protein DBX24_06840 [Bergeyella cardium]WHE33202.1 helix-turn-helix transcriptional regulator [Bergeyella cardium]WHF59852.1 helix-turn-helix transcriptional regulator [Bergeyella cardium]